MILCNQEPRIYGETQIIGIVEIEIDGALKQQEAIIKHISDKGSLVVDSFIMCLEEIVLPAYHSDFLTADRPLCVVLDVVRSHFTKEVREFCRQNNILMTALPPHCTHVLQGEDIYHFGIFQKNFYRGLRYKICMKDLIARLYREMGFVHHNTITADINEKDPAFLDNFSKP